LPLRKSLKNDVLDSDWLESGTSVCRSRGLRFRGCEIVQTKSGLMDDVRPSCLWMKKTRLSQTEIRVYLCVLLKSLLAANMIGEMEERTINDRI
ncbi:MAG: hypothetical protein K2J84_01845, partial [Bacteroidaceae bacterium]|nr:hypothetical protein [Bacteroidaceae bacterium]